MKDAFARDFEKTLTKMKWPGKDVTLSGRLEQEWASGVEKLLDLQEPYVRVFILGLVPLYQTSGEAQFVSKFVSLCSILYSNSCSV